MQAAVRSRWWWPPLQRLCSRWPARQRSGMGSRALGTMEHRDVGRARTGFSTVAGCVLCTVLCDFTADARTVSAAGALDLPGKRT